MAKVVKSAFARKDFSEIFQYMAVETSLEHAQKFLMVIEEKCELLAKFPQMGKAQNSLFLNLRTFPIKNYIIFYFPTESGIEVLRVLHASRDVKNVFETMLGDADPIN